MKKTAMRTVCIILTVLLALSCLSGCDLEQSITDRFISVDTSLDFPIPRVRTFKGEDEINKRLENYFAPVILLLDNDEYDFSLRHDITRNGSLATVSTYVCGNGGEWPLSTLDVYMNGTLYLSDMGDIAYLGDGDFLSALLALSRSGYLTKPDKYYTTMSCGQVYTEMIRLYESFCGHEIDCERISESISGANDYLKAVELFMEQEDENLYYNTSIEATGEFFTEAAAVLVSEMLFDPCGKSSTNASVRDLLDMCELFASFRKGGEWESRWSDFARNAETLAYSDQLAVRDSVAQAFVDLYDLCFGDSGDLYEFETVLVDTDNEYAITAVSAGFLPEFPDYELFSGEYIYPYGELANTAANYVSVCYSTYYDTADDTLIYRDFIYRLGDIVEYADNLGHSGEPLVTVMNTRDYDFYIRQHDGTQYEHVNCMPTISAMAIKWYSGRSVTPSDIRALFLPESKEGWYMWQVEDALDEYSIPHESYWLDLEDMLSVLDSGRIILTQMSETNLDYSGHCLVIWGYKRCGDAVRFYCHDPGMEGGQNKYHGYRGDGIVRDGAYIYYIIDRFAFNFVGVGDYTPEEPDTEAVEPVEQLG